MARFPFINRGEKNDIVETPNTPPEVEAGKVHRVEDHGADDMEESDDLHRGMKPRQLSEYGKLPSPYPAARTGDPFGHAEHTPSPLGTPANRRSIYCVQMAIAGAIGTGLIIGTNSGLPKGPGALLIGYVIMGICVFIVMVALGEMGAWLPHKKSFSGYATRFVDPALGFATGWNYFLKYAIVLPNNLTATGILIQKWRPDINVSVWVVVFGIAIILLNLIHVSFFGEAEFWMSLIKALVIVILILMCFIIALGGGPSHQRSGFYYWENPGAFAPFSLSGVNVGGDAGRFLSVWACIVQATFAYLGTELVGVAFGETPNPRKNIPKAVNQTLARIIFFYIGGVITLGMALPYNDDKLAKASTLGTSGLASPFTIVAVNAGIKGFDDAINALLMVFTISAANSDIYLASRSAWALAKDGQAPAMFHRTNARGVPIPGVVLSSLFIALGFLNASNDSAKVFKYFVSLVTVFGALNWISVLVSYMCMIRGMKAQGIPRSVMPFRSILLPWGAYLAFGLTVLIIIFQGYTAFVGSFKVDTFITSYIGIIIYVGNILIWKFWKKTKMVRPMEMDLQSGRREF